MHFGEWQPRYLQEATRVPFQVEGGAEWEKDLGLPGKMRIR